MSNTLQSIKQRYGIVGRSEQLDRALSTALRVAATNLSVLITGESGVGKEVFSRIIHEQSARKHNKFIAINCGAIPEGTINSELFGHEKGAFTGATGERKGYFETYDGGTIFLDEIAEMPLDTQSYLLRVLETGEFIRVGSSQTLKTDVRIIAATNVDLDENIRKNKFREDLYFRLNTVPIRLPALRDRQEDIYLLFRKFVSDFAEKYRTPPVQLDERAQLLVENYNWPGNIRELKNVAEQLSVLSENRVITSENLLTLIPTIAKRNLPVRTDGTNQDNNGFQEREILYKLLFDMKRDLNDLKSLVFELIRNNDLNMPDTATLRGLQMPEYSSAEHERAAIEYNRKAMAEPARANSENFDMPSPSKPIILDGQGHAAYDPTEEVEETLSIEENEKELIRKALRKHSGKRKEASQDLGISERTLYRKIKEYDI